MKKSIFMFAVCMLLMSLTSALSLSALDTPYEFLDTIVMKAYKPIIWYIIIGWAQSLACSILTDTVVALFASTNTLTSAEQTTICKEGVEMYWEQFYYGGSISNQPYDLGWSWSAS